MAVKALIFGTDDLYPQLKPFYEQEVQRGNLEIVGYAAIESDGRVFRVPNLDFPRLLAEGVAYGAVEREFSDTLMTIYPRIYRFKHNGAILKLGGKSYIAGANFDGIGITSVKKFCSIAGNITVALGMNNDHNYHNVSS